MYLSPHMPPFVCSPFRLQIPKAISCLWPLLEAGFGDSMDAGQTFIVTGGHGSLAPFVVAVLKAWGGRVALATTKGEG